MTDAEKLSMAETRIKELESDLYAVREFQCEAESRSDKAEARVKELESDLHAAREFQDEAEARAERAKTDVSRMQSLFDEESRIRREWAIRADKAESRVRELETRFDALIRAKDSGLFYVEVETPCAFEDVHAERVERVEKLWDDARAALAGGKE